MKGKCEAWGNTQNGWALESKQAHVQSWWF